MLKKAVLAMIAVFILWSVIDYIIHGLMLRSTYEATAQLWRPMAEMKMGLMYLVYAVSSVCFVSIYALLISPKSVAAGVKYGLIFGLGIGFSMGYGTYSVMPVPQHLALVWFLGTVLEITLDGLVVGLIIKEG